MRSDFDECASVRKALGVRYTLEFLYNTYTVRVQRENVALGLIRTWCVVLMKGYAAYAMW